jgi:hypothetical protein
MNMKKTLVLTAVFIMIAGFLAVGMVHAQVGWAVWEGEWFRVNSVYTGYVCYNDTGRIRPDNERETLYIRICSAADTSFWAEVWAIDGTGTWSREGDGFSLAVFGGTPLDFLVFGSMGMFADASLFLIARITGKEDKKDPTQLKRGKLRTVGALYWDMGDLVEPSLGGGVRWVGNRVLESKLPFNPSPCLL